jgi:hypothetical protein
VDATGPLPEGGEEAGVRRLRYVWQVPFDRSYAAHVEVDSHGAAIVSGSFFDTKDITLGKTTLHSNGAGDIMLARILAAGTVDWARSYGGIAEDYPVSFALGASDAITLTGLYNGTGNVGGPDFPAFAGTPNRYDVYVAGLDSSGNHRWSKTINANAECFAGPGLSVDGAGDVFLPGTFLGTATIGSADHVSTGSWDGFLARYDEPNGALGAVSTFGGTGEDRAGAALFDGKDVIVVGRFSGSVTFPTVPTPTTLVSAGGLDVFVAKLAPDFSHTWSVGFGGDADDAVRDVAVGRDGTVALTGEFRDRVTFGADVWTAAHDDAGPSQIDAFVAELSGAGAPLWSTTAGGTAPDRGLNIALDGLGGLYVTATFQSPVDFGGGDVLTPDPGAWASALVRYAP